MASALLINRPLGARLRDWVRQPIVLAVAAAAVLAILWITLLPTAGTDLSAQIARADFASRYPDAAYDFSWYGGIYPAAYAVLAPYVFAAGGTLPVTAAAMVVSAGLIAALLVRYDVPRARLAGLWGAVALWTGVLAGRATFTLGVAVGLAAVLVIDLNPLPRPARLAAAAVLAFVTSLMSPIAGLFLGVVAGALLLTRRRPEALVLGVGAGLPFVPIAVLFAAHGVQPITVLNGAPSLLAAAFVVLLVPRRWRVLRWGALIYGVAVIVAWVIPSPVGSNIERLGLLLVGPLFVGLVEQRSRFAKVALVVLAAIWQFAQPVRDLAHGSPPPTTAADTAGLVRELGALRADTARVEAVPEYGHWESLALASAVPLARGWERQIDTVRNPLFYKCELSDCELGPRAYHRWLRANAVRYVAISNAKPDYAAAQEAAIVRAGQPWLVPVWHDSRWRLYRVADAVPLTSRPGRVLGTTPAQITIAMPRAGSTILRVRWSPLMQADGATLTSAGQWTRLHTTRAGRFVIRAPYP